MKVKKQLKWCVTVKKPSGASAMACHTSKRLVDGEAARLRARRGTRAVPKGTRITVTRKRVEDCGCGD